MKQNQIGVKATSKCIPLTVDITPILNKLYKDAPISTRKDVNFYQGYPTRYDFRYDFVADANWTTPEWGSVILTEPEFVNPATIAHELTHAYLCRAFKEIRGYAKLMVIMKNNLEFKDKLEPIAEELKKGIRETDTFSFNSRDVYYLNDIAEGLAHACESKYGKLREDRHDVDTEINACDDLINLIGIDGARSFVRNKLRNIYINETPGKSLVEEVNDYKEDILNFFDKIL